MANGSKGWDNVFIGFGIATVISGIYLITQQDYIIGISGTLVGLLLILQNRMKSKRKDGE